MNINKIADYGIKIVKNIAIATGIYTGILLGAQGISQEFISPKINNQSQLEQILNKEKKQAGIKKDIMLDVKLGCDEDGGSYSEKISEKKYKIRLSSPTSLSTLKHELYHIADGHCDNSFNRLKYFFIDEPQATIYEITGLKP